MKKAAPKTVSAYLAGLPLSSRKALKNLRAIIKKAAPEAEEVLSYQMPAFRQNGILVYYAGFKDHLSLFVASYGVLKAFKKELKHYLSGKATLRFTAEKPLPAVLVRKLIKARVKENTDKE